MNGCTGNSLKYPASMGGAEMAYIPGCPVETLAGFCAGCEWMGTQDICYDTAMPASFVEAYPDLVAMIGAPVWPHTMMAAACPDCPEGECEGQGCRALGEAGECDARQLAAEWSSMVKVTPD